MTTGLPFVFTTSARPPKLSSSFAASVAVFSMSPLQDGSMLTLGMSTSRFSSASKDDRDCSAYFATSATSMSSFMLSPYSFRFYLVMPGLTGTDAGLDGGANGVDRYSTVVARDPGCG